MIIPKISFILAVLVSILWLQIAIVNGAGSVGYNGESNSGASCQCNCCHLCPYYRPQIAANDVLSSNDSISRVDSTTDKVAISTNEQNQTTSKRRRKSKKKHPTTKIPHVENTTKTYDVSTNHSTDIASIISQISTNFGSNSPDIPTSHVIASTNSMVTSEVATITSSFASTTTATITTTTSTTTTTTSSPIADHGNVSPKSIKPYTESSSSGDQSELFESFTDDLTRIVCSSSPDWLIKTKITDNRLVTAMQKQKIKVRTYKEIFGGSNSSKKHSDNQSSFDPTSTTSGAGYLPTIFLRLNNKTIFATAVSNSIFYQPLHDVLTSRISNPAANDRRPALSLERAQNSSTIGNTSRTYLIFGTGSLNSTHSRVVTSFVVWPSNKITRFLSSSIQQAGLGKDEWSQDGGQEIIKAYRAFKSRGASVCLNFVPTSLATTSTISSTTPAPVAGNQRKRARSRKHKSRGSTD